MDETFNTVLRGDCIARMDELPAECVELVFADPPFNIGYDYDVYDDSVGHEQYIGWSKKWISAVSRVLKPDGTFWLAIGDEYAAELKLASRDIGFHCRSWVIWYYTFGVNCAKKFTRSHAHLFHFVKNPEQFTFRDDDLDNRVPSARELVYKDKRANPRGRLPDDTWIIRPADAVGELIGDDDDSSWPPASLTPPVDADRTYTLRPQDLDHCFNRDEDTWYFPRVAGTFKERAGFHGCQMPEQLLGRIIRTCSHPGDVVLDPFSGSATTLAVAKKLGRRFVGFDVSEDYVRYGLDRLDAIRVGDRLDGSPEPLKSAPRTGAGRQKVAQSARRASTEQTTRVSREARCDEIQVELTLRGVTEAFRLKHDGYSVDRVVADPGLNKGFVETCTRLGLAGDPRTWNMLLFRLRKAGKLAPIPIQQRTCLSWEECDDYVFASEIAWQSLLNDGAARSLDEILCDPALAARLDAIAGQFAPGFKPLDYRWAALKLRKAAKTARSRASVLTPPPGFGEGQPIGDLDARRLPQAPGLYVLSENRQRKLYVGETLDLRQRFTLERGQIDAWLSFAASVLVQTLPMEYLTAGKLAWQSCIARKYKPRLNCFELHSV